MLDVIPLFSGGSDDREKKIGKKKFQRRQNYQKKNTLALYSMSFPSLAVDLTTGKKIFQRGQNYPKKAK